MEEKIKIYLDTNMVIDIFINQAKALKDGKSFEQPKKYQFMIEEGSRFEFVTSFLAKAEVMRELLTAFDFDEESAEKMWGKFIETINAQVIEEFTFDKSIVDIVSKVKLKLRTMFNFMHIFIAMKEGAYFVSGDKDIIEKIRQTGLYDKAINYIELRKLTHLQNDFCTSQDV